jgi:chromatin remodeling complex protein RSC6
MGARRTAKRGARKGGRKAAKKGARRPAAKKAARRPAKKAARKAARRPARKKAAKKSSRKKAAKKAKKKGASKRKPNPAFMKAMKPSASLAAVVGDTPMPRTEVTKKLWAYIKKNNLQDAKERRMINADDKLKSVFGGKSRVSMFEMTKLVNKHLQ